MKMQNNYNPDVLSCLANLSSDEVFTPPKLANEILDLLPQDIWEDKSATFLDPVSKSGVFLREIAARLLEGLKNEIPDLQKRINHIYSKQLFGIGITELTSFLARRSLYCSKTANKKYSVATIFNNEQGNIFFEKTNHDWENGRCVFCGASQSEYEREEGFETHAYQFIHNKLPDKIKNMKFDVIIGNPPYQISDAGAQASAMPLYHHFVRQAKKLNPRFLTMIIPSRWFAGGKGLDEFRIEMLNDDRVKNLVDYPDSSLCFPGVSIKGGVCYFLWDRDNLGLCKIKTITANNVTESTRKLLEDGHDTFIRYNEAISVLKKVQKFNESSFIAQVSVRRPFGFSTDFKDYNNKQFVDAVKIYANKQIGYIEKTKIIDNLDWVNKYKIYITRAYGAGETFPHQILNKPILGELNSCCTETYLVIGPYRTKKEAQNALSYITTRFFRFLVLLKKTTQDATRKVYSLVPMQDFSESWTDEKLYKKYKLTKEEIEFIESMVRPMN
jgi:site-specific DNA-methyltransferase (adenine-specific)